MEMIFAFVVFVLFVLGMAIGYIVKGKPLKGSCGGVANLMGNESCEICGGDPVKCDENQQQKKSSRAKDLSYDASKKNR